MMLHELSLFSGYGGFSLGLRLAGLNIRTVAYVEWAKYPQEIIKARIQDGYLSDAPIFSDISSFRGEQFRGLVDIITGGFPCQPHSVAGLQRGADDERNLWPETLRVIREVAPRYVLLENVPGLLSASSDGGRPAYGGTVVGELASLGYSVHWQTIGADDVGASHRRKRWWCIGVANTESQRNQRRPTEVRGSQWGQGATQLWEPNIASAVADSSSGRYGEPHEEILTGGNAPEYGIRQLDDPQHDGYVRPQETGSVGQGSEYSSQGENHSRQSTGPGISAARGYELADSRQQPTGAEGRGLDGGREDASPETGVRATEGHGLTDGNNPLADSEYDGFITPEVGESKQRTVHDRGKEGTDSTRQSEGVRSPRNAPTQLADSDNSRGREDIQSPELWATGIEQSPSDSRLHRQGEDGEVQTGRWAIYPTWPPSPNDTDGWERVLRERPDLAPAITKEAESQFRRVDDGPTNRLDRPPTNDRVNRIKALGNGIVPAVAAAFLRKVTQ
jgi:site-specific DNA-cytosine methylase